MSKIRVYELAKELDIESKELLTKIKRMGIEVKSHMSGLEDEDAERVRDFYTSNNTTEENDVDEEELRMKEERRLRRKKEREERRKKKEEEEAERLKEEKRKKELAKKESEKIKMVEIPEVLTVKELGQLIEISSTDIIKYLMMQEGVMATLNQEIDYKIAEKIAEHFDVLVEKKAEEEVIDDMFEIEDAEEDLEKRAPVVVVMGHVDHGKTSLLDAMRSTDVIAGEAGGITQHIGASKVKYNDQEITFLDTPGHEAFTAMRLRGAQSTDIAILVVAADDGVMPQTIEAINHAKTAGVEIIVAINKMDIPTANPEKVKQELAEHGVVPEDWGGDTICIPVSALKKEGIDELLDTILLVAEMEQYKANPNKPGNGIIIESQMDKQKGVVATLLVQEGTIKVGDSILAGTSYGRVRAMVNDKGKRIKKAGPSQPVEILGLNEAPPAGERCYVTEDDRQARKYAEKMMAKEKDDLLRKNKNKVSLDDLFTQIKEGNMKKLNIIVKGDVQGSVQALTNSLEKLSNEEVLVKVIHGAVGGITESDIMLASTSGAIIIGFNVRPSAAVEISAEKEGVDVRLYRVIYKAIDDVEAAMKGMLDPEYKEKVIGHAEVREIFTVSKIGTIAGSYVKDGEIRRDAKARLVRDSVVKYEGELGSLKRFDNDAKSVQKGYECGIMFENYNDIKEGDIIEAFIMEEIKR